MGDERSTESNSEWHCTRKLVSFTIWRETLLVLSSNTIQKNCLCIYFNFSRSTNIRGILLTSTSIIGIFGTLAAYSIGPFVSYAATGYIALVVNLVHVIGILFIPESPVYYAIKGDFRVFLRYSPMRFSLSLFLIKILLIHANFFLFFFSLCLTVKVK